MSSLLKEVTGPDCSHYNRHLHSAPTGKYLIPLSNVEEKACFSTFVNSTKCRIGTCSYACVEGNFVHGYSNLLCGSLGRSNCCNTLRQGNTLVGSTLRQALE